MIVLTVGVAELVGLCHRRLTNSRAKPVVGKALYLKKKFGGII